MPLPNRTPPLVAIYWNDHSSRAPSWEDTIRPGEVQIEAMPIVTVGWLQADTPEGVVVACEQVDGSDAGEYRGSTTVLREHVIAIRLLRRGSLWKRPKSTPVVKPEDNA